MKIKYLLVAVLSMVSLVSVEAAVHHQRVPQAFYGRYFADEYHYYSDGTLELHDVVVYRVRRYAGTGMVLTGRGTFLEPATVHLLTTGRFLYRGSEERRQGTWTPYGSRLIRIRAQASNGETTHEYFQRKGRQFIWAARYSDGGAFRIVSFKHAKEKARDLIFSKSPQHRSAGGQ